MSRSHDGHWPYFPFGNPFKMILPKGSYLSPKLLSLINSFEETLAERFRKLKPKDGLDALSLFWMNDAVVSLSETHTDIKSLITELQFPVADWDGKWMDMYLDSSVKLLDICIAFSSKLSQIGQGQLFLQYVMHILDPSSDTLSKQNLKQVRGSLHDYTQKMYCSSPRFENSSSVLQELVASLHLTKVKNSSKGKVLMRAMYGVKVQTVFVCTVLSTALSGSQNLLMDFPVSEKFIWAEAFKELQSDVNAQIKRRFPCGRIVALKELEAVDHCVEKLLSLTSSFDHFQGDSLQKTNGISVRECEGQDLNCIEKDKTEALHKCILSLGEQKSNALSDGECEGQESNGIDKNKTEALHYCVLNLGESSERLADRLELLSKQVEDFFQIVLTGRDALLCNLRMPDVMEEDTMEESRS